MPKHIQLQERVRGLLEKLDVEVVSRRIPSAIPVSELKSQNFFVSHLSLKILFMRMVTVQCAHFAVSGRRL